jgi:hypothetical protein
MGNHNIAHSIPRLELRTHPVLLHNYEIIGLDIDPVEEAI